jgi:hypothetical protein
VNDPKIRAKIFCPQQRLPANGVVFALDWDIGDLAFVTLKDRQQSPVTAVNIVVELNLVLDKGGLIGRSAFQARRWDFSASC